jgi:hypothetical protein
MLAHVHANHTRIQQQAEGRAARLTAAAEAAAVDAEVEVEACKAGGGAPSKASSRLSRLWGALGYHVAVPSTHAI